MRPSHPLSFGAGALLIPRLSAVEQSWAAQLRRALLGWGSTADPIPALHTDNLCGDYLFGSSGFYLNSEPCSFIHYFMSYHCTALQAVVKIFSSLMGLSLPFWFSGFYLNWGDP